MELEIPHLMDWFGKQTIKAAKSQITITDKNILGEVTRQYDYSALSENTIKGKTGNKHFSDLAGIVLGGILLFSLISSLAKFTWLTPIIYRWIAFPALLTSAVFLILRLYKNEFVWFTKKDGNSAFSIKVDGPKNQEAIQMLDFIMERISNCSN